MEFVLTDTTIKPEKIITCRFDTNDQQGYEAVDIAEFDYYHGIECMKANKIPQITKVEDMSLNKGFLVTCGKVLVRVQSTDYSEIKRIT